MKLPETIKGKNRLRDFDICRLHLSGKNSFEIKNLRSLPITVRRIEQILYDNAIFINPRMAWPKSERIFLRQRIIVKAPKKSKKDIVDQLNDLTKEIEGEKSLVDLSQHTHYTFKWKEDNEEVPILRKGLTPQNVDR